MFTGLSGKTTERRSGVRSEIPHKWLRSFLVWKQLLLPPHAASSMSGILRHHILNVIAEWYWTATWLLCARYHFHVTFLSTSVLLGFFFFFFFFCCFGVCVCVCVCVCSFFFFLSFFLSFLTLTFIFHNLSNVTVVSRRGTNDSSYTDAFVSKKGLMTDKKGTNDRSYTGVCWLVGWLVGFFVCLFVCLFVYLFVFLLLLFF